MPQAGAELPALQSARRFARALGSSGSAGCGAEFLLCDPRAPRHMEQSFHPPLAGAELPALRSARRSARYAYGQTMTSGFLTLLAARGHGGLEPATS